LTGVFPGYAATAVLRPVNAARLLRAAGLPAAQHERLADAPAIELLEHLGARWYRAARDLAPVPTARIAVVGEVADRFGRPGACSTTSLTATCSPRAAPDSPRPLQSGKTVKYVTLPNISQQAIQGSTAMHIFAAAIGG